MYKRLDYNSKIVILFIFLWSIYSYGLSGPGFSISLSEIFLIPFLFINIFRKKIVFKNKELILLILISFLPLLSILFFGNVKINSIFSYFRYVFWVLIFLYFKDNFIKSDNKIISKFFLKYGLLITFLGMFQKIIYIITGKALIYIPNFFAHRGTMSSIIDTRVGTFRSPSIFTEPAWAALFIVTSLVFYIINYNFKKGKTIVISLVVLTYFIINFNLTGIILMFFFFIIFCIKSFRRVNLDKLIILQILLIIILFFIIYSWDSIVNNYAIRRLINIIYFSNLDASSYQRLIVPFFQVKSSFDFNYFLGIGLGNNESDLYFNNILQYDIDTWNIGRLKNINSIPFAILTYFGILGSSFFVYFLFLQFKNIRISKLFLFYLIIISLGHGDFLTPGFWVPLMLLFSTKPLGRDYNNNLSY